MAFFRVERNKGYTVMSNHHLRNKELSLKAKGLLSQIVERMKQLDAPNSPNKTHFMVELSPTFMQLTSSRNTERLAAMLPYKSLVLSSLKDRHGVYAQINKDENRDREIKKPRQSIRAQLKTDKAKTAPKKAAKTKNHELEV